MEGLLAIGLLILLMAIGVPVAWSFAGTLAYLVFSVWGYFGTRQLVVKPLEVSFPELPPGLNGMRIVHLSDLHVGPHTPTRFLVRVAEAVEEG